MIRTMLITCSLLTLLACGAEPLSTGSTEQALLPCYVNAGVANQIAVQYSDGSCVHYNETNGNFPVHHQLVPGLYVTSVATGTGMEVIVGDGFVGGSGSQTPLAWSYGSIADYAPSWNGGQHWVEQRFWHGESGYVTRFVGWSFSWRYTRTFPTPPACTLTALPGHSNYCNFQQLSDSGGYDMVGNTDPNNNQTCCNVSGTWPDGSPGLGAPCSSSNGTYVWNNACPTR